MKPVEPLYLLELFPPLSKELIKVLRMLQPGDWDRPTTCSAWSVKDVAAHLLGGNLGRLWNRTETNPAEIHLEDYDVLVGTINRENDLWVQAARRISPQILIEFLEITDRHLFDAFRMLDQDAPARISVAWASDDLPPNWFDIAREYTEKWLHQQHIREAVNQPILTGRAWLSPVLDTFIRGLPRTFRNLEASNGTSVSVQITGESGGEWSLIKEDTGWQLFVGHAPQAICRVQFDQDLAWRLFSKGISKKEAKRQVNMDGNSALGEQVLEMVSIMA